VGSARIICRCVGIIRRPPPLPSGRISLPELKSAAGYCRPAGPLAPWPDRVRWPLDSRPVHFVMSRLIGCRRPQVSVNRLFIAGVIPGLMLIGAVFGLYRNLGKDGNPDGVLPPKPRCRWLNVCAACGCCAGWFGLNYRGIGSIYAGVGHRNRSGAIASPAH